VFYKAMMSKRVYTLGECIVFRKTKEAYGGLSNMAAGYSLNIMDVIIPTAEHLYQACRFPAHPELQSDIISEISPMKAKWLARKHLHLTRNDWNSVRFKVMYWVLEVKLSQNLHSFGHLLRSTGSVPLVEFTPKDKVWGAVKEGNSFVGTNALGRLLMALRLKAQNEFGCDPCVPPLDIEQFYFLDQPIGVVCPEDYIQEIKWLQNSELVAS
jgi:ribA/ribD-fused uncharacterized protein